MTQLDTEESLESSLEEMPEASMNLLDMAENWLAMSLAELSDTDDWSSISLADMSDMGSWSAVSLMDLSETGNLKSSSVDETPQPHTDSSDAAGILKSVLAGAPMDLSHRAGTLELLLAVDAAEMKSLVVDGSSEVITKTAESLKSSLSE